MMNLIESHNESVEGNKAIHKLNVEMVADEIKRVTALFNDALENCDIEDMEEYEEQLNELLDLQDELEN